MTQYKQPNVIPLGLAAELVQSSMDKPSCMYWDNVIVIFIEWSTGTAYQVDE
jgi:hypothetical protein